MPDAARHRDSTLALRYHGGKFRLAPWVISFFPKHDVYLDAYGGGASVLIRKPMAQAECYNDLDGSVVSYFRVLRNEIQARELKRRIELTPFSHARNSIGLICRLKMKSTQLTKC